MRPSSILQWEIWKPYECGGENWNKNLLMKTSSHKIWLFGNLHICENITSLSKFCIHGGFDTSFTFCVVLDSINLSAAHCIPHRITYPGEKIITEFSLTMLLPKIFSITDFLIHQTQLSDQNHLIYSDWKLNQNHFLLFFICIHY